MKRTVEELLQLSGNVYIYVPKKEVQKQFLVDAEREGFSFGNGVVPTQSVSHDLYRIYPDKSMCYVMGPGYMGFLAWKVGCVVDRHYINYEKYMNGEGEYDDFREANPYASTILV
ncbi:MAG: hypothetical protein K6C69_04860 [Lachnospiraceae bacterium]|nr:hypothetical protein [Lachnospiraceae bacterium]